MADVFVEIRQVVLTSLLSLVVMFVFTRIGGKRQIAQMSPFDYLNAITVGSIGAELATNLEQWWRPLSALIIYILATWLVHAVAGVDNGRSPEIVGVGNIRLRGQTRVYLRGSVTAWAFDDGRVDHAFQSSCVFLIRRGFMRLWRLI